MRLYVLKSRVDANRRRIEVGYITTYWISRANVVAPLLRVAADSSGGQHLVGGNANVSDMSLLCLSAPGNGMIERWRQVYSTQSISPDSHKVAEFYAAVHTACALPSNHIQIPLLRVRRPTETSARGDGQARCPVRGVCCCANTHINNSGTFGRADEKMDGGGDKKTPGGGTTAPDDGELGGIALGMEVWRCGVIMIGS